MMYILNQRELSLTHLNGFPLFLSYTNTQFNDQTVLFQRIQFTINTQFIVYIQLGICSNTIFVYSLINVKTVLLQTI